MLIFKGKLCDVNGLDYQVYLDNGEKASFDYQGHGVCNTRNNGEQFLVLGNPWRDVNLYEYRIDSCPTQESRERLLGYNHALQQKRQRGPSKYEWSENFWDGWRQGWSDKRKNCVMEEWRMQSKVEIIYNR
jgi:hypothetical protein